MSTHHILPFFWLKGEDNAIIQEELDRVEQCGIKEICLESRPHPDFCGTGWWDTLDVILAEAHKRGLRVWILDDDKFPTGHCNGAIERQPEKGKVYLAERHVDIMGPCENHAILVEPFLGKGDELLGVVAFPKPNGNDLSICFDGVIDLTKKLHNGFVYFDLPEGAYRLFVLYTTMQGGGREHYVNLIDTSSVQVLINEVYETHYARYKDYFGNTIAGFFSDEPELGNVKGYGFEETLGKKDCKLPWSKELCTRLQHKWKENFLSVLPSLWYDSGNITASVRFNYMNELTKLVHTCFSAKLGEWCQNRGVEYVGHIIEDDNAHARLGCSVGHYFREMQGQHMAGIDVVHHQILPGFTEPVHQWIAGDRDGEFFHFGLAKLCSSAAHIDQAKKNRALCEIFGNYGWAEGVSTMKWLTNHMLVRGINYFTPHAFSLQYPDRDCPPHFYARGKNPIFPCFAELMKYMEKAASFLSTGVHQADAAILYHAESEWTGGNTMYFHVPGRTLMENQFDYDVIPADVFLDDQATVVDGNLCINKEQYPCFIIPSAEYIVEEVAQFVIMAQQIGLSVFVINDLPKGCTNGNQLPQGFDQAVMQIAVDGLADQVHSVLNKTKDHRAICSITKKDKGLRKLIMAQDQGFSSMWFNENYAKEIDTIIETDCKEVVCHNLWGNTHEVFTVADGRYPLKLAPGEAQFLLFHKKSRCNKVLPKRTEYKELLIDWNITKTCSNAVEKEEHVVVLADTKLPNLNSVDYWPTYTGTYRYQGYFTLDKGEKLGYNFIIAEAADCLKVVINGQDLGYMAGFPSAIRHIESALQDGENTIEIDVYTTLVWERKDGASTHMQVPPTGITKPPIIEVVYE